MPFSQLNEVKPIKPTKVKKYVFRVYTTYDPDDGFNAWVRANSRQEAECEIRCEHHSITRVELLRIENA